jgi:type IV secretion system protein VirB4
MWNLREYRKKAARLADLLPWGGLIAPGVICNKDGCLQSSLRFRGPDLESATEQELMIVAARLNNVLKRFRSGWALFIEASRHESSEYPVSDWPDPVSALIDEERRALFAESGEHFETEYFLSIVYQTPTTQRQRLAKLLYDNLPTHESVVYEQEVLFFQEQVRRFADLLRDVLPLMEPLTDAETLTYLHSTVSTKRHRVQVPSVPMYLDALLTDEDLLPGLRPKLGDSYLRTCTIKEFPNASFPGILEALNQLPLAYRYVERYAPLDRVDAVREIRKYERKWLGKRKGLMTLLREAIMKNESQMVDPEAEANADDARHAQHLVAADEVSYGYGTMTVTVWDTEAGRAAEKLNLVERAINGQGFVTHTEDINAVEAWLGSIPGHVYANVRRYLLHSLNVAHLFPGATAAWAGPERNTHLNGPVLMHGISAGGTPFRISYHDHDVGDTLIIGPKGAGKSLLLKLSSVQWLRYPQAQVRFFSRGGDARAITAAVGGQYYQLGGHGGLAFQPLADIDNLDERSWYAEWVSGLFSQEGLTVGPALKEETWAALTNLAESPHQYRTMTGLAAVIQSHELRQALRPYTLDGASGHVLDADCDHWGQHRWQCFEMEHLFATPSLVAPTLSHVFHRIGRGLTGSPTIIPLDEAWLYFTDPVFGKQLIDWLVSLRKLNGSVILSTQSLAQILESPIAASIAQECVTRIFLPNPAALDPEIAQYYERFGCNRRQRQLIAHGIPKRDYYFMGRQGNRRFELGCGPITLEFCGSDSIEEQTAVKALIEEDAAQFPVRWLEAKQLDWAADLLREATGAEQEDPYAVVATNGHF